MTDQPATPPIHQDAIGVCLGWFNEGAFGGATPLGNEFKTARLIFDHLVRHANMTLPEGCRFEIRRERPSLDRLYPYFAHKMAWVRRSAEMDNPKRWTCFVAGDLFGKHQVNTTYCLVARCISRKAP